MEAIQMINNRRIVGFGYIHIRNVIGALKIRLPCDQLLLKTVWVIKDKECLKNCHSQEKRVFIPSNNKKCDKRSSNTVVLFHTSGNMKAT